MNRCTECNNELSYCGANSYDGPLLDCEVCQLKQKIKELEKTILEIHKDYGFEVRDPNGTIWEVCNRLHEDNKRLRKTNELLDKENQALKDESKILDFIFHYMNSDFIPKRTTYGQWKKDIIKVMKDKKCY